MLIVLVHTMQQLGFVQMGCHSTVSATAIQKVPKLPLRSSIVTYAGAAILRTNSRERSLYCYLFIVIRPTSPDIADHV